MKDNTDTENVEARTEREQLELKVHYALRELSSYFKKRDDPLKYEVNRLWQGLDRLRSIPEFPGAKQKGVLS